MKKVGEGLTKEEQKELAQRMVSSVLLEFHPMDRLALDAIEDESERRELARKIIRGEAGIWAQTKS